MRYIATAFMIFFIAAGIGWGYAYSDASAAGNDSFTDLKGHWAKDTIEWGAEKGIARGYPDATFRPGGSVTEAEFIAMLFRAYPGQYVTRDPVVQWYSPYYAAAEELNWPAEPDNAGKKATRGQIARLLAASQGKLLSIDESIVFVLEHKLAQGRGSAGFDSASNVTRAEAVQFVRNLVGAGYTLSKAEGDPFAVSSAAGTDELTVAGVRLGDTEAELLKTLGAPGRKDSSEYGFTWYVYNQNYRKYAMAGVSGGQVVALYANGTSWSMGTLNNSDRGEIALNTLGTPLEYILKGSTRMMLNDGEERDTFQTEDSYITVFYDVHQGGIVSAILAVDAETEQSLKSFYLSKPSSDLRASFERQSLDLANSARVKRGLKPFAWDGEIAGTARKHSSDMAANSFFSHENLAGADPFDRMEADGIEFRAAAENIAAGQANAIFAHEGWMNSKGHRINILGDYERLGVGVSFASKDGRPYYTQNFFTPLK